jgi:alcohol dehydrogenase class IV
VHVASYPVTVNHGAAHGHACGLFLPAFLDFFYDKSPKLKRLLPAMHANSKDQAVENLRQLLKDAGLKHNLSLVGVEEKELDEMAAYLAERPRSNPVNPTQAEFRAMLEKSFK